MGAMFALQLHGHPALPERNEHKARTGQMEADRHSQPSTPTLCSVCAHQDLPPQRTAAFVCSDSASEEGSDLKKGSFKTHSSPTSLPSRLQTNVLSLFGML